MDDTIINVMFISWHFQVQRGTLRPSFTRNQYHIDAGWPDGYFRVYNFLGYRPT